MPRFSSPITAFLQDLGQRREAGDIQMFAQGIDAVLVAVLSGDDGGAAGRAERVDRKAVSEQCTVLSHPVEARGADMLAAETAEIPVALVVGEDDDEIGGSLLRRGAGGEKKASQPKDQEGNREREWEFHGR